MIFTELQQGLGKEILESLTQFFRSLDLRNTSMAYSGGLDSSLLLSISPKTVIPYTLGDRGSKDFSNSESGSRMLGYSTVFIPLSSVDLEKYVGIVGSVDPKIKKKDLGYETVLAVLLDKMKENRVITGQGADEIFYGYNIFRESPQLDNSSHMKKLYNETLPREKKIAEYFGKELITPYLSDGILEIMKGVDRDTNFAGEYNKAILRTAAIHAGMPTDIVERKKTAAQYGSGLLKKLKSMPLWNTLS